MCTNVPDPLETAAIQTLISLWKTLPHSCGSSRWPDLKAGGPAMALMHRMWMRGGNKSSLVHGLHREIKAISFSSWGKQNSQSSLCWDLHIILLSETLMNETRQQWDFWQVIHMSLQNASVRWEMKFHVKMCLCHRNCCLTCSQTSILTPCQVASVRLGLVLTVPVLLMGWWSSVVWEPKLLNTSWLSCAFLIYYRRTLNITLNVPFI